MYTHTNVSVRTCCAYYVQCLLGDWVIFLPFSMILRVREKIIGYEHIRVISDIFFVQIQQYNRSTTYPKFGPTGVQTPDHDEQHILCPWDVIVLTTQPSGTYLYRQAELKYYWSFQNVFALVLTHFQHPKREWNWLRTTLNDARDQRWRLTS